MSGLKQLGTAAHHLATRPATVLDGRTKSYAKERQKKVEPVMSPPSGEGIYNAIGVTGSLLAAFSPVSNRHSVEWTVFHKPRACITYKTG